ncbi:hypothetical protein J2T19_003956 [Paenibacillus tundrae]|uniref:Uncharacterized protein n=1 Tax=Paenibacillus tundrae TaxID=528187 RepID=A0ABT9WGW9_9BACL|nr:hypothetical protein [Paenibacillus tundrae]
MEIMRPDRRKGAEPEAMATYREQGRAASIPVVRKPSQRQWRPTANKAKP